MSNKVFIGIILILSIVFLGFIVVKKDDSGPKKRLGLEQEDKGRAHIAPGAAQYETDFPTSGAHDVQPAPWNVYKQEVPNENVVHNMEHGGIIITYRSDLPQETITKIERLFSSPFSNPKFQPSKAIVMPGSKNDSLIIIRSWNRLLKLDTFNEQTMINYYLKNVNKSPEPAAS